MKYYKFFKNENIRKLTSSEIAALIWFSDSEDSLVGVVTDVDPSAKFNDVSVKSYSNEDAQSHLIITCTFHISMDNIHNVDKTHKSYVNYWCFLCKIRENKKRANITWTLRSNTFAFTFKANTSLPQYVVQLDTPYQFYKYFFTDDTLKLLKTQIFTMVS